MVGSSSTTAITKDQFLQLVLMATATTRIVSAHTKETGAMTSAVGKASKCSRKTR